MDATSEFDTMIDNMKEEIDIIEANRAERNRKYTECMNMFKDFLSGQAEALESSERENTQRKELVSRAFENTFSRILSSSDVSVRKIKQTFQEKKEFWDNVIKMNANIADIELKKEFYLQKRNAEEGYFEATDHQKDKHKPYHLLMNKVQRKEPLRDFQNTNKHLQEKVMQGTNTLQHWQKFTNNNYNKNNTNYGNYGNYGNYANYLPPHPQQPSAVEGTVLNKFVLSQKGPNQYKKAGHNAFEGESNSSFLNNFTKKY